MLFNFFGSKHGNILVCFINVLIEKYCALMLWDTLLEHILFKFLSLCYMHRIKLLNYCVECLPMFKISILVSPRINILHLLYILLIKIRHCLFWMNQWSWQYCPSLTRVHAMRPGLTADWLSGLYLSLMACFHYSAEHGLRGLWRQRPVFGCVSTWPSTGRRVLIHSFSGLIKLWV